MGAEGRGKGGMKFKDGSGRTDVCSGTGAEEGDGWGDGKLASADVVGSDASGQGLMWETWNTG